MNWCWARFDQVATIASNLVSPNDFADSPHVAPDNIEKGTGNLLPCKTVAEDAVRSANHRFFAGQIIYSKIRPNLSKAVSVDFDGLCSADMYPLNSHIDAGYLLRFILSSTFLGMAVRNDTRVAMPKINQEELSRILVAVPPLAEQRRIVGKVDQLLGLCDELAARQATRREARKRLVGATLDRLVSARSAAKFPAHAHRLRDHFDRLFDRLFDTLPQLRQAILQLAVQGQLVPQDVNDEPIDAVLAKMWEHKRRLIDSRTIREPTLQPPVSDDDAPFKLPTGWRWQRWGNICDWITYGFTRPMSHVDSGPPIVTAKNVRDGFISLTETHDADAAEFAALSPKDRPRKGDLLIVKDGATIGRAAIVEDDQPFCISQTVAVLWLESCRLYRPFLLLMIQADAGRVRQHPTPRRRRPSPADATLVSRKALAVC